MKLRQRLQALVYIVVAATPIAATAWGADGHQIVAGLAYAQLTPVARKQVDRLLALEPGATLASLSNWADE